MATKEEVLRYIKTLAEQKVITKDELDAAFNSGTGVKTDVVLTKKLGIAEIIYYIGGAVVFLGISILLWQNWSTLAFGTKVLATLGSGIAAYIVGLLFSRDERTASAGSAFFLIVQYSFWHMALFQSHKLYNWRPAIFQRVAILRISRVSRWDRLYVTRLRLRKK